MGVVTDRFFRMGESTLLEALSDLIGARNINFA